MIADELIDGEPTLEKDRLCPICYQYGARDEHAQHMQSAHGYTTIIIELKDV